MSRTRKYARRAQLNDRIEVAITSALKERAYGVAAKKGLPAAEFIRQAIARSVETARGGNPLASKSAGSN